MIQLNLLPDVKANYIKAQRSKRMVLVSCMITSGVSLGIVILLATIVYGGQKLQLSTLDSNITKNAARLKNISGINKILTIQNQLNVLTGLHDKKPVTSRLFVFMPQVTPNDVKIGSLNTSFEESTMQITGTAKSLEAINKFIDTLKFTDYTTDQSTNKIRAFSTVVLASFSSNDKESTYNINLKFDPAIFSSEYKTVTLSVPTITSTRSQTEQPNALFKAQTIEE